MKFKSTLLVAVIACAASAALSAATPGPFIGASAGYGRIMTPTGYAFHHSLFETITSNNAVENKRTIGGFGYALNGGYNVNQYFGVEGNYIKPHNSEYKGTEQSANSSAFDGNSSKITYSDDIIALLADGYLPIGKSFNLVGKAGAAYVMQKVKYEDGGLIMTSRFAEPDQGTNKYNSVRPMLGAGMDYYFTKNFSADLAANYIFGKGDIAKSKSAIPSIAYGSLGLAYHFA